MGKVFNFPNRTGSGVMDAKLLGKAKKILGVAKETGTADINSDWKIYTIEYIKQGRCESLKWENPFKLNRHLTMTDGKKCAFVILHFDLSREKCFMRCGNENMAHFQIYSVLFNGEPDFIESTENFLRYIEYYNLDIVNF